MYDTNSIEHYKKLLEEDKKIIQSLRNRIREQNKVMKEINKEKF